MQCDDMKNRLDMMKDTFDTRADVELQQHLKQCGECSDYRDEVSLLSLMEAMPVRDPSPGFEHRVLRDVRMNGGKKIPVVHARWALATAASMLFAVLLTLQFTSNGPSQGVLTELQPVRVSVVPRETRLINVRMHSNRELQDARISILLDDNLTLEGYAQVRNLEWSTNLKSGDNYVALPVQLLDRKSGTVTIIINHENFSRRLTISVDALPDNNGQNLTMA